MRQSADQAENWSLIELRPDGWERFRRAVHAAADNGPNHKASLPGKQKNFGSVRAVVKKRSKPT